jgi:hypothetical protein
MRRLPRQSVVDRDAALRISDLDRQVRRGAISQFGIVSRKTRQGADKIQNAITSQESVCAE